MIRQIKINQRVIGPGNPTYIIAEMSANHNKNFNRAVRIVEAAKEAGADAVKLQTYLPETITIDCDNDFFKVKGTLWEGQNLFKLYGQAYTPWEWQPKLKKIADRLGITLFSTPFDYSAVEFLEKLEVPAYKVASFELIDLPLIAKIARTGKPLIMSTGMASLSEINEAVRTVSECGNDKVALLKCTSAYPAPAEEMNLRTIPHLAETFGIPVGLSDHSSGIAAAIASVALGGCIVEKHVTLSRADGGPDSAFSLEPDELKQLIQNIRVAEKALGRVSFELNSKEKESRAFRRSLFVVKDIQKGDRFTNENIKSIRPGFGMAPKLLKYIIGRKAEIDLQKGTPLEWLHIGGKH